ncbi:hypothetical protein TKK_0016603 [Trichogramma kaykai]
MSATQTNTSQANASQSGPIFYDPDNLNNSNIHDSNATRTYAKVAEKVFKPDMGVLMEARKDVKYTEYISAFEKYVEPAKMLAASRIPNQRICVYFDSAETAKYVYNKVRTIKVGDEDVNIRSLRSPNTRVIISNVNPEISLMSITPASRIATLKNSYEDPEIAHMICWRRQVFIKPADVSKLAPIVAIQKNGVKYNVYFSTGKLVCFTCNAEGHMAAHCSQNLESTNDENQNEKTSKSIGDHESDRPHNEAHITSVEEHNQDVLRQISSTELINQLIATPTMPQENNRKRAPERSNSSQASMTEAIQEKDDEKEMKEHVNKAVEKLPEKKLDINSNTVSQFLFDTYGKSDIEDTLRNITCDLQKLDNALRDIRNIMPPNILARVRRFRTKISAHQNMDIDHSDDNLTQKKKNCA